jgi:hypothetical protein
MRSFKGVEDALGFGLIGLFGEERDGLGLHFVDLGVAFDLAVLLGVERVGEFGVRTAFSTVAALTASTVGSTQTHLVLPAFF